MDKILASNCPPITSFTIDLGAFTLTDAPPAAAGVAEAYSPRRFVLDQILIDAAVAAGVELQEGLSVQEVMGDGDRIGADGRHSLVARTVQASEYNTKPPLQGTSFTYWSGVPAEGFEFSPRDYRAVYAGLTNDNLALIGVNWTGQDCSAVRAEVEEHDLKVLDEGAPRLAEGARRHTRGALDRRVDSQLHSQALGVGLGVGG